MTPRMRSGQQPSGKSDWETPDGLVKILEAEFGNIELDPCATRETAKAHYYFGPDSKWGYYDGLEREWLAGFVFVNPPYGRNITKWVEKCYVEVLDGNALTVVALLPVATDTAWWRWVAEATEIRFLIGRVHFKGVAGPAPFASAIVIWRRGMLGWHRVSYWDWKAKL